MILILYIPYICITHVSIYIYIYRYFIEQRTAIELSDNYTWLTCPYIGVFEGLWSHSENISRHTINHIILYARWLEPKKKEKINNPLCNWCSLLCRNFMFSFCPVGKFISQNSRIHVSAWKYHIIVVYGVRRFIYLYFVQTHYFARLCVVYTNTRYITTAGILYLLI